MTLVELVRLTLEEDVGPGDVTTRAVVDPALQGAARIVAKQPIVVSGQPAAAEVFRQVDARYEAVVADGAEVEPGTVIGRVEGSLASLLTGERSALNFLMRLCGVATHTRSVVRAAHGLRVVDTRKTTPLLRALEKDAVRHGGAANHRYALYDGVLIKDNHIVAAGGLTTAVRRARQGAHHLLRVEVEVEDLGELAEALAAGADVVLLDNMDDATLREAVAMRTVHRANGGQPVVLEASGNMTAERIATLGDVGLDFVSMGGLIHQARWADLSMRIEPLLT
ncbi:MAG: carboxylating nicotinate-nucleotide diphosphorylase [Pseudomonadota bacterium]|nr:carboxylating nicotinate-nucleotide diphosphorylase [Pseudomonadota bacterium]